ncbi:MAG TPA: hemerythrin domain-containing protein [Verrucomicrobiae bacterium]|nr:hemerythrin domain-containing protein [Verrucomicrobiae bacterium]
MKITEALLAEHQVFHNLFDHVEAVVPKLKTLAEARLLAELLATALKAHSATEDDLLLTPMDHCIEQLGQADTFHKEHDEIDNALLAIQGARQISTARRLLLQAVQASRVHFDKEERIVFPLAERSLSDQTLNKLGGAWARRRESMPV